MKSALLCILGALSIAPMTMNAQSVDWPEAKTEAKPGTRWWWLGSAVDKENLSYNLETYSKAGIGAVEITPIYGVIGNEKNDIDYLTDSWMDMLRHVESEGARLGIEIDMNNGTGWPFGGPEVTLEEAATKAIFNQWSFVAPTKWDKKKGNIHSIDIRPQDPRMAKELSFSTLAGVWAYDEWGNSTEITSFVTDGKTLTVDIEQLRRVALPKLGKKETLDPRHQTFHFVALWHGKTRQAVKRAAPGGEGFVMDHFSPTAVGNYFSKFDKAFDRTSTPAPHTFFNDSYEVYGADWTPALLTEFAARRGYHLEDNFRAFLDVTHADHGRLISDYRETLSDLLLEVFTHTWADWAHKRGAKVRNQAHGSPANLLDVYSAVDIPEIEGFGLSDFGISGLRTDTLTKKNDSDLSMLKYPASAAHFYGKPYVSAETFTWLTEHFRTSLSQCKPDFDLMMVSGVNHIYFHGTTYSPREDAWPGHLFYASMEMSPINTIWRDAPAFFQYITRCQSFMQWGNPDNDFLVYLPVYDIWNDYPGRLLQFDIHSMDKKAPAFIKAVGEIYRAGYDMDYVSDRMIEQTRCEGKNIVAPSGVTYKALILPAARFMQPSTLAHILSLADAGATVVFVETYPNQVPGMSDLAARQAKAETLLARLPKHDFSGIGRVHRYGKGIIVNAQDYATATTLCGKACGARPETMKSSHGVSSIRRRNATGHHYFISSLQSKGVDGWVRLGVHAESAVIFDPLTGNKGIAEVRQVEGATEVRLQLASGESCILQTYEKPLTANVADASGSALQSWSYLSPATDPKLSTKQLTQGWSLSFPDMQPAMEGTLTIDSLMPWTHAQVAHATSSMGTARYSIDVKMSKKELKAARWILDLGDVRESAHVYVNGVDAGTAFAVPYRLDITPYLRSGKNHIDIDVTSLAANYVAEMDRQGIIWRKFKNANIANLKGGRISYYGNWDVMPCGLNSTVSLVPMSVAKD